MFHRSRRIFSFENTICSKLGKICLRNLLFRPIYCSKAESESDFGSIVCDLAVSYLKLSEYLSLLFVLPFPEEKCAEEIHYNTIPRIPSLVYLTLQAVSIVEVLSMVDT